MTIYTSPHPHPVIFKNLVIDGDEVRVALFCETCRRTITQRAAHAIQPSKKEE